MWPDQVSNPGPLTYESGALPTALCGPAWIIEDRVLLTGWRQGQASRMTSSKIYKVGIPIITSEAVL